MVRRGCFKVFKCRTKHKNLRTYRTFSFQGNLRELQYAARTLPHKDLLHIKLDTCAEERSHNVAGYGETMYVDEDVMNDHDKQFVAIPIAVGRWSKTDISDRHATARCISICTNEVIEKWFESKPMRTQNYVHQLSIVNGVLLVHLRMRRIIDHQEIDLALLTQRTQNATQFFQEACAKYCA